MAKRRTKKKPICATDGCKTISYTRGYCRRHHRFLVLSGQLQTREYQHYNTSCTILGCNEPVRKRGMCDKHASKYYYDKKLKEAGKKRRPERSTCEITRYMVTEPCDRPWKSHRLCEKHYQWARRNGYF
jgi:hypothetical protein